MPTLWDRDDGILRVHVYTEKGRGERPRVRVRWTWRATGERCASSAPSPKAGVAAAEHLWRSYLNGELDAPDPEPLTLSELCDRWLARPGVRPNTVKNQRTTVNKLLREVGDDRRPRALTPNVCARFVGSLGGAASTRLKTWCDL